MSYIPMNPYYAWVSLKIGLFEATPIPPEHLISMEFVQGVGGNQQATSVVSINKDGGASLNPDALKAHFGESIVCQSAKIVLFDETALRVEAQIILGQKVVQMCYGYVNGPNSQLFNLRIDKYVTSFSKTGSATLTLDLLPSAMLALKTTGFVNYEGLTLNEIVEAIRVENNWQAGDIADIENSEETIYERDPDDPGKFKSIKRQRVFIRMNQNPIEFLQYEIAPYCRTKVNGQTYGDFRLYFEGTSDFNSNSIQGNPISDIANEVTDYFKGYMTSLTDPLTKELNKVLGEVLSWAAESLAKVQELIGTVGDVISDAMSSLTSSLGSLQSVAKQAITSLLSGGLAGLTTSLTNSLVNAGINLIRNAVGSLLDKVTGGLMNSIGSLTGLVGTVDSILSGNIGGAIGGLINTGLSGFANTIATELASGLAGGLGGALTKLNELTNVSFLSLKDVGKLLNSSRIENILGKQIPMQDSIMNFRPPVIMDGDGVDSDYYFEVGVHGGSQGESSVLEFNYSHPGNSGSIMTPIARNAIFGTFQRNGGIALSTTDYGDFVEAAGIDAKQGAEILSKLETNGTSENYGAFHLALSSETPEGLDALAQTFSSIYRKCVAGQVTMKIFGDPTLRLYKKCQIIVMTKLGQIHYSSGYYFINKITNTIQGGTFVTNLELMRHPEDKSEFSGYTNNGVLEDKSINNSGDTSISITGGNNTSVVSGETIDTSQWEEDLWGNYTRN